MSLINDMLRDLERRQPSVSAGSKVTPPVAVHQKRKTRSNRVLISMSATLLPALLIWAGWMIFPTVGPGPDHGTQDAAVVTPLAPAPGSTDADQPPAPSPPDPQQFMVAGPAVAAKTDQASALLTHLFLDDQQHRTQLRLVFHQLPDPVVIEEFIEPERVVFRLHQVQLGDGLVLPQPGGGLVKSLSLSPGKKMLDVFVDLHEDRRLTIAQRPESLTESLLLTLAAPEPPVVAAVMAVPPAEQTQAPPAPVRAAESTAKTAPQPAPPIRSQPPIDPGQQAYQRGLRQYRQGDLAAAAGSLAEALTIDPRLLQARLQLISILQQQSNHNAVQEVLLEGLSLTPEQPDLRKLHARQLLRQQRFDEALELLERAPIPALNRDLEYHALRAAVFQENGYYAAAADVYVLLLERRPQEALWWLGLAISLEQQGEAAGARDAYQAALAVSGLTSDVELFVRGRLQAL